jgi:transposase
MFKEMVFYLPDLKTVLCDGAYTGDNFACAIYNITCAKVEVAKRSELHKFEVIPKRWVVERSFGWLDKCRRLWKNCERLLSTTLNFVKLAFISILLKRL